MANESKEIQKAPAGRAMDVYDEMDRLFDNFFGRGWMRPWRMGFPRAAEAGLEIKVPTVDVVDRDNEIVVRAELPGVEKKDLDVTLSDDAVTIKGSTRTDVKEEKGDYYRREISEGTFSRTVALPATINTETARASFKDGLLELTLPKVERAKKRSIKVD